MLKNTNAHLFFHNHACLRTLLSKLAVTCDEQSDNRQCTMTRVVRILHQRNENSAGVNSTLRICEICTLFQADFSTLLYDPVCHTSISVKFCTVCISVFSPTQVHCWQSFAIHIYLSTQIRQLPLPWWQLTTTITKCMPHNFKMCYNLKIWNCDPRNCSINAQNSEICCYFYTEMLCDSHQFRTKSILLNKIYKILQFLRLFVNSGHDG